MKSCSFCPKTEVEVKKLIAGPTAFICDECVGLCNTILEEELGKSTTSRRRITNEELDIITRMLARLR